MDSNHAAVMTRLFTGTNNNRRRAKWEGHALTLHGALHVHFLRQENALLVLDERMLQHKLDVLRKPVQVVKGRLIKDDTVKEKERSTGSDFKHIQLKYRITNQSVVGTGDGNR